MSDGDQGGGATPTDELDEIPSGPFCRHWDDLSCDKICSRPECGHSCPSHWNDVDCDECACAGWVEPPTKDDVDDGLPR